MKQLSNYLSFLFFPAGVLFAHLIASRVLHLYLRFPHLDVPAHFIGGLSIAYSSSQILAHLEREKVSPLLNKVLFLILLTSLTATAAVFWEFAEFIADRLMNTNIQVSLANTMQDQFMGLLGGAAWALIYSRMFLRTRKRNALSSE